MLFSRRRFLQRLSRGAPAALALSSAGCGLLLHPERNGQPHSGRLDPSVVILDAVGCLFFLVPGLIAFIVDFSTGTIYLPPGQYGQNQPLDPASMVAVQSRPETLTRARIERTVAEHTGEVVSLDSPELRLRKLDRLDECRQASIELAAADRPWPITQLALD